MTQTDSKVLPSPPSLVKTLLAGFDVITNHLGLILFSIFIDLLLWFGPQIRLKSLIQSLLNWMNASAELQAPEMVELMDANRQAMLAIADRFNLVSVTRTFPVGIPSLMFSRAPVENPLGVVEHLQLPSALITLGVFLLLLLTGIFFGTLYFDLLARATLYDQIEWRSVVRRIPRNFVQVLLLALFMLGFLIAISIPLSCLLPLILVTGAGVGRFILIIYGIALLWLLLPMSFSPHGIFYDQSSMWNSVRKSARLARFALPSTSLFVLAALLLSQGMDLVWNLADDASWLALVGVVGHAFVATGLLSASFIYYRDANNWLDRMVRAAKLSSSNE